MLIVATNYMCDLCITVFFLAISERFRLKDHWPHLLIENLAILYTVNAANKCKNYIK